MHASYRLDALGDLLLEPLAVFPLSLAFYGLPLLGRLGLRWSCAKDIRHAKAGDTDGP